MSLWLALTWLVCAAVCIGVFGFCRKRIADIGERVAEEMENRVNKIATAERNAEVRLLETFSNFGNPPEAIRIYQKIMADIFRCPQAKPPWNWSQEDLQLWRKQAEGKQTTSRSRSTILTAVIVILALTLGAAVTTVISLNTIRPLPPAQTGLANIAGGSTAPLPPPVSMPAQSPPAGLPPLPTQYSPMPPDDTYNPTKQPAGDVDNSLQNSSDAVNKKIPGPDIDGDIPDSGDTPDKAEHITPDIDGEVSNSDDGGNGIKDVGGDINNIPNSNTTESSDLEGSKSIGENDE